MKVFLTGAGGFIARALADRLRARGDEVNGVDLSPSGDTGVVTGDITLRGPWQQRAAEADVVVHTAAIVSNAMTREAAWRVNVLGTRRVAEACAHGRGRLVHVSSVRAFGDSGFPDQVTEDHPVRPDGNAYVDTKIASEQVVLQAHAAGEVVATVVRPGDVYGPGSRPWTLIPVELIRRRAFALPARGRGVFSPVHVDDLVAGLLLAVEHPDARGQVFTLAGGVGVPCAEFFGHYARMLGRTGVPLLPTAAAVPAAALVAGGARLARRPTEVNPVAMRYLARPGTYSIAKARQVLGYQPRVSLAEGMARTEAWLRAQRLL